MTTKKSKEARMKQQAAFDEKFEEAFTRVRALVIERGKGYRVTSTMQEYFPDGVRDALYEVNKKLLRARNLLNAPAGYISDGPLEDSILDGIAYLGFAYALHVLQQDAPVTVKSTQKKQLPLPFTPAQ